MSFSRFIENFKITNNELEAYLVSRLIVSNKKNILQNVNLSEYSLHILWKKLSAREKVSLLESREIPNNFRKFIINQEKSITVISALLASQPCDKEDIEKLIHVFGLKLRDKLYQHNSISVESKILLAKLVIDKYYLNEVINNNINIGPVELTTLLSSEKIMYVEKQLIAKAYLNNERFRENLQASTGTENMVFFASSPFLTPKMLSNILTQWDVSLEESKFILLGLIGNPLVPLETKKMLHQSLLINKPSYWDYELENQISGMLSNAYYLPDYSSNFDEEVKIRIFKRILPNRFKPEGRILDIVAFSFNEYLTFEEKNILAVELERLQNFSLNYDVSPDSYWKERELVKDTTPLDYEKNINILSNGELVQLSCELEDIFGNDFLKWETLFALYPEYNGDTASLVSLTRNV